MSFVIDVNFGEVKAKPSSEEVLQRWRDLCSVIKNSKRRFRFTANLSKRYEAADMRQTNKLTYASSKRYEAADMRQTNKIMIGHGLLSAFFINFNRWVMKKVHEDNKNKLLFTYREMITFSPTLIAGIFTVIALEYPGETTKTKRIFGFILWGLTSLYLLSYYVRVLIDMVDDNVRFFFYKATTRGGRRVFYSKAFQHIVGFVIVVLVGIVSYLSCFTQPSWGNYYLTLVAGILNVVYAMLQSYRTDTNATLVEDSDEGPMSYPIQVCRRIPPRGRSIWYERIPGAVSSRVLD